MQKNELWLAIDRSDVVQAKITDVRHPLFYGREKVGRYSVAVITLALTL